MKKTGFISPGEKSTLSGDAIAAGGGAPVGGLDRGKPLAGAAIGGAAGAAGGYLCDRHERIDSNPTRQIRI